MAGNYPEDYIDPKDLERAKKAVVHDNDPIEGMNIIVACHLHSEAYWLRMRKTVELTLDEHFGSDHAKYAMMSMRIDWGKFITLPKWIRLSRFPDNRFPVARWQLYIALIIGFILFGGFIIHREIVEVKREIKEVKTYTMKYSFTKQNIFQNDHLFINQKD